MKKKTIKAIRHKCDNLTTVHSFFAVVVKSTSFAVLDQSFDYYVHHLSDADLHIHMLHAYPSCFCKDGKDTN